MESKFPWPGRLPVIPTALQFGEIKNYVRTRTKFKFHQKFIELSWCSFTDEDLGFLLECLEAPYNHSVQSLYFFHNILTNSGASYLAVTLSNPDCRLISVDVCHNLIGDEGASLLAEALKQNTTLARFYIFANKLTPTGGHAFLQSLKDSNNRTLKLLSIYAECFESHLSVEEHAIMKKIQEDINNYLNNPPT
eukprot:TRINITY_DN3484_c0_g1_i1.p1 TRINITY_DN3484_c0_g1~~TRINITY_DN3484_c0_g1_i1.p1  ORF type:complete len:193 (-),score=18.53 TRINITY_DN3484_c0_g1_i1:76-654(-)